MYILTSTISQLCELSVMMATGLYNVLDESILLDDAKWNENLEIGSSKILLNVLSTFFAVFENQRQFRLTVITEHITKQVDCCIFTPPAESCTLCVYCLFDVVLLIYFVLC